MSEFMLEPLTIASPRNMAYSDNKAETVTPMCAPFIQRQIYGSNNRLKRRFNMDNLLSFQCYNSKMMSNSMLEMNDHQMYSTAFELAKKQSPTSDPTSHISNIPVTRIPAHDGISFANLYTFKSHLQGVKKGMRRPKHDFSSIERLLQKEVSKTTNVDKNKKYQQRSKLFNCPWKFCTSSFYRPCDLERHFRSHTQERNFICDACGRAFLRADHLKKHKRMHCSKN